MNISSPQIIGDEPRSLTPEPNHAGSRTPRRSHVSISSSKRPSMNAGASNSNKIKQGMFRRAVPQMPRALACICFVCNLVLPGTGTNYLSCIRHMTSDDMVFLCVDIESFDLK